MFELMDSYSQRAVIKVIGVGGGGGNAVQHMLESRTSTAWNSSAPTPTRRC
jgi:cell division GTPase FtsZ